MISITHYSQGFNMIHEYNLRPQSDRRLSTGNQDEQAPTPPSTPHRATKTKGATTPSSKRRSPVKSPFFQQGTSSKLMRRESSSCMLAPPLTAKAFGLIQERLHGEPFQLLIAVVFLNRTKGIHALPVFFSLMELYPTPQALANAPIEALVEAIRHLGFQNQRAKKLKAIAQTWIDNPPHKNRRYRTLNYPSQGDGKDMKAGEVLSEMDMRQGALEIAHIPGLSRYAWDSWRIFCRDELRGLAEDYSGTGAQAEDFEPEWKRVLPEDKELRPCLRWMWLKEGWDWDCITGKKTKASQERMDKANAGLLDWHDPLTL